MSRTSTALKRLGVAGLAAVTLGAGVPVFFATSASAAPATTIDLEPESASGTTGQCTIFNITLRDSVGNPATESGTVTVSVSENPASGTQSVTFCAPEGADATTGTSENRVASETFPGVTSFDFGIVSNTAGGASIQVTGTSASGDPLTSDSGAVTFSDAPAAGPTASASASASPTAEASASPSATATQSPQPGPTATVTQSPQPGPTVTVTQTPQPGPTVTVTQSPSPTATMSPSPTGTTSPRQTPPGCAVAQAARTRVITNTISAGARGIVEVDASPNSIVRLEAYTRPSTTFRVVREAEVGADGRARFDNLVPPANTRFQARESRGIGCAFGQPGQSVVMNVRTTFSLFARRVGPRTYVFSGDTLPARRGGLIVSLYRVTNDGRQILTSQTRANAVNGEYSITRRFTGSGRFGFVVRAGQDLQNAPGSSNVRSLAVF